MKMKKTLLLLIALVWVGIGVLGVSGQTEASEKKECYVPFVDQGSQDPSFVAFRTRLSSIVKRKDKAALLAILDPNITVSFGGDGGRNDFKRFWELDSKSTRLWEELDAVLRNGGYLRKNGSMSTFSAPFSFEGFGGNCHVELDAFEHKVIFGSNVALRREGSPQGELITRLSYNVVDVVGEKSVTRETGDHVEVEWFYVKTFGGLEGYVHARYVRSPVDYRALFEKRNNRWRMSAFVAGD